MLMEVTLGRRCWPCQGISPQRDPLQFYYCLHLVSQSPTVVEYFEMQREYLRQSSLTSKVTTRP